MKRVFLFILGIVLAVWIRSVSDWHQELTPISTLTALTHIPAGTSNSTWIPVIQDFDGVDMVYVPGGCFMMGTTEEQIDALFQQCETDNGAGNCIRSWFDDGHPHEVCLDGFWIDRTEVTNAQFAAFNGQAGSASNDPGPNRPREYIDWNESQAFCESRGARLPTEAEWEYAARGPEALIYPWGNEIVSDNVVYMENSDFHTADVGSRPGGASWVGAMDMTGNVVEWVADWYSEKYYDNLPDGAKNPTGPIHGYDRASKGGSWYFSETIVRAATRFGDEPNSRFSNLGFRCSRSQSETP